MSLIQFSEPAHVPLLLAHKKLQTTRPPRKRPPKVGGTLYCYYKPRMKPSCLNCINLDCAYALKKAIYSIGIPAEHSHPHSCEKHNNYFGEAVVTKIIRAHYGIADPTDVREIQICHWNKEWQDEWARADGFEDFEAADDWFTKTYNKAGFDGSDWINWDWTIIKFQPKWEPRKVA